MWERARLVALPVAAALAWTIPAQAAGAPRPGADGDRSVIGRSVDNREIVAIHRSGAGPIRARLVVIGQVHGNETAGMAVVRRLATADLPAGLDLWLIPTANPDGLAARTRANANGVDLNRNFPASWRASKPGTATYSGPARASEPETRTLTAFLDQVDADVTLIFHQPLYGVDTSIPRTRKLARTLARHMHLPGRPFRCSGKCHGTLTQWYDASHDGLAVTVELSGRAGGKQVARAASGALSATMAAAG